ncbi:MAG TPA: YdcH family protein [Burkholderiales bacterium]|nr:YdcH family protein [Burkholderiales bacterium]
MTDFPLTEEEQAQVQLRLQALEIEHHDLDDVIFRLAGDPAQDQLQLRRLKKRKLFLKDQIQRLRARLIPDIIA